MKLNVTIEIPDTTIESCANERARGMFHAPTYTNDGGEGFRLISEQVGEAVSSLDFSAVAKATAERFAAGIIEDITKDQLKKMARKVVKEMAEAGDLYEVKQ